MARLFTFALLLASVASAQEKSDKPDEPAVELPTAAEAARLFGTVADTSKFLNTPAGSMDALLERAKAHDRPIVVVQYGDSHTQAGILPRELRDQLAGGGTTSPGFVAPGLHNLGDASVITEGHWKKKNWIKPEDQGSFGPLGMAWVTHASARVVLRLRTPLPEGSRVTAFYSRAAAHIPFKMIAGGKVLAQVGPEPLPKGDHPALGSVVVVLAAGTSEVELTIAADKKSPPEFRFFGFLVQEPGAAVEWDALGITGTSVEHPLLRGDRTVEEYLALRQPDLVIVWFGSNSLVAPNFDPPTYGKDFGAFLARVAAAAPKASRLAIGPPDLERRSATCPVWYGHQKRHLSTRDRAILPSYVCAPETTIVHRPGQPDLFPVRSVQNAAQWLDYIRNCSPQTLASVTTANDAERTASLANGFAYFDTFAFMDGPGSIHRWACQVPRLAAYDLVHLTADGYSTLAQGLWGALPAVLRTPVGTGAEAAAARAGIR